MPQISLPSSSTFVVLAVILGTPAFGSIQSAFDTDTEGWVGIGANASWESSGGNPDGYLKVLDADNSWGYVRAPNKFNVPAAYNGAFSFDLRAGTDNTDPILYKVRAALVGNGLTLINELELPTTDWKNYSFTLNELSGWREAPNLNQNYNPANPQLTQAEMLGVLANLTEVYIATDYTNGTALQGDIDRTDIDNVRLSSANPVPEPATVAVWSMLGLFGFGYAARRNLRGKKSSDN